MTEAPVSIFGVGLIDRERRNRDVLQTSHAFTHGQPAVVGGAIRLRRQGFNFARRGAGPKVPDGSRRLW